MSRHLHLFDIGQLTQARLGFVREARGLRPGTERNQKRQIARSLKRLIGLLPAGIQQEHLLRKAFEANEAVKMNEQLSIPAVAGSQTCQHRKSRPETEGRNGEDSAV